jgi:hypothetical protein
MLGVGVGGEAELWWGEAPEWSRSPGDRCEWLSHVLRPETCRAAVYGVPPIERRGFCWWLIQGPEITVQWAQ